jgi:AcrR family transcriptional regulator
MKKRQDAKDKILGAAIHEFAYHGFSLSVASIARKAHVNEITVWRYFKTKDILCNAAIRAAAQQDALIPYLEASLKQNPLPALSEVVAGLTRLILTESVDYYRLVHHAVLCRPDLAEAWDKDKHRPHLHPVLTEYVRRLLAAGILPAACSPQEASRDIFGLLFGSFIRNALMPASELSDADPAGAARRLFQALEINLGRPQA